MHIEKKDYCDMSRSATGRCTHEGRHFTVLGNEEKAKNIHQPCRKEDCTHFKDHIVFFSTLELKRFQCYQCLYFVRDRNNYRKEQIK